MINGLGSPLTKSKQKQEDIDFILTSMYLQTPNFSAFYINDTVLSNFTL